MSTRHRILILLSFLILHQEVSHRACERSLGKSHSMLQPTSVVCTPASRSTLRSVFLQRPLMAPLHPISAPPLSTPLRPNLAPRIKLRSRTNVGQTNYSIYRSPSKNNYKDYSDSQEQRLPLSP